MLQEMSVQTISRLLEEMEGGLTSLPAFLLLPRPQGAELRYRNHAKHNLYNLYKKIGINGFMFAFKEPVFG